VIPTIPLAIASRSTTGAVNPGKPFRDGIETNDKRSDKVMAPSIHLQNALTVIRQGYCLGANAKYSKGIVCGVLDPIDGPGRPSTAEMS
jgi:hypothetical protein